jgi:hypothetical protein
MKKLKMPTIDTWQKRLIAKSERLRRKGRPHQGEGAHQTPAADAQAGPVALVTNAPRRNRRKDADDLQAITVDYQQALEIRWWYYRRTFLEAMKLDLEIRSEQTQ